MTATFNPLPDMHIITMGTEGADCFAQAVALQELRPNLRFMLGSVMAWCQDDRVKGQPSYWQRPWCQHCWLIDEDGSIVDPAIRNLQHWADNSDITLPCAVDEMTATVIPWDVSTIKETVHELINCKFNATPDHQLVYLPGAIFGMSHDIQDQGKHFYRVWGSAAMTCANNGGLDRNQYEVVMRGVNKLMAAPRQKKTSKGFGGSN